MDKYFGRHWPGEPFRLFDASHLWLLATLVVVVTVALIWGRRTSDAARRGFRITLAVILVVNVAGWHLWNAAVGTWTLEELLPLHLCSAALPVVALALVLRHHLLAAGSWLLAAPGALQAILTPEVAPYGFPHYRVLQSWLAHGGLFLAGAWLVFAEGLRPTLRHVVQWWLILHAYAAVVYGINAAIGSNYLFLNHKPEFASILDALPAWPWYLLILEALVVAFMLLFWAIGRRWRRSRTTAA